MATREQLEAAVLADPTDDAALMVLGDFLQAHGDPRGEWISLQRALRDASANPKAFLDCKSAADAYYRTHEQALLGELYPLRDRFELEWHLGYIRSVKLLGAPYGDDVPTVADVLHAILAAPSSIGLSDLAIAEDSPNATLATLVEAARPAGLRSLTLGLPAAGALHELPAALGETFRQLRRLTLHGQCDLDRVVFPRDLEYLYCNSAYSTSGELGAWRIERLPKLRTLRFYDSYGRVGLLAGSTLLPALATLDLGEISEYDGFLLAEGWEQFQHLKKVRATMRIDPDARVTNARGEVIDVAARLERTTATITTKIDNY